MKDICVFIETEIEHNYDLLRSFDNDEDLELWLKNTTENKNYMLIMRKYNKKPVRHFKCDECGEISSDEEINKATK